MAVAIYVYTQFPHNLALGSNLDLDPTNWFWVRCLTFPLKRLRKLRLSLRPFKWIRYAIGVVVGAQGDLSTSADSLETVDYNATKLPNHSISLYYHLNNDEKRRMFPLDPRVMRTSETSSASSRRVDFRNEVESRDGDCCVLSGIPVPGSEAVHLLPHTKGDDYISVFTQGRSRDSSHGDVIRSIDSVRNGIFLNVMTHRFTGKDVAFLPTPNFAMDTADVDPAAIACSREQRYTTHLFTPYLKVALGGLNAPPSGTPIQISDSSDWPPAVLFDSVYASAVFHHFGTKAMKDIVSSTWDRIFYPSGVVDQAHADYYTEEWNAKQERKQEEALARPDFFDMLLVVPYMGMPPDKLEAYFRQARERAAQEEQRRVHDKVEAWMSQCNMSE